MREELSVAHSIISFDNIGDLLEELDSSLETYSKLTKRYEDRLGILLRSAKESADPKLRTVSAEMGPGQPDSDQKKKKEDKKREVEEKGWIVLESGDYAIRVANGADTQMLSNEISLLFKVIETLKSKTVGLESCRKMVAELTTQGFRSDRRLMVVFKDGLPKYLIPTNESSVPQFKKFKYGEQFRLAVLK